MMQHISSYMGPVLANAVMARGLTFPHGQGQNEPKFRHQAGASYAKNVAGGESPYRSGQGPHVSSAAFSRLGAQFMGVRAGGGRKARRCSIGLSTPVSVAHPCERGLAVQNRNWSIIMANNATTSASSAPAQSVQHADGTTSDIRWIRQATVEKRIRRKLAEQGKSLLKTRIGTTAHRELGEFAVLNSKHEVEIKLVNLRLLAMNLGVLANDERIDPVQRGWKYHVARARTETVNGITLHHHDKLTRDYATLDGARRAAEGIEDKSNLVFVGWDATVGREADEQEGGHV
jgi:hypothetical protein